MQVIPSETSGTPDRTVIEREGHFPFREVAAGSSARHKAVLRRTIRLMPRNFLWMQGRPDLWREEGRIRKAGGSPRRSLSPDFRD